MTKDESHRFVTATRVFTGQWASHTAFRIDGATLTPVPQGSVPPDQVVAHIPGTVFAGFTDSHVHLGLIDGSQLNAGGIARVIDLGWDPARVSAWKKRGIAGDMTTTVEVDFVGAMLTVPGGYPSTTSWAPAEAVREISTADDAALVVAQLAELGASAVKITLNSDAGAVFSDELLSALVAIAHRRGLPVIAHTEGAGQAARALAAGVDRFAHTPFSERLSDDEIAAMAGRCSWISTLDIHGWGLPDEHFAIASDNLARFAAAGGEVVYGTDLGNGDLPIGINVRELTALSAAGLSRERLVKALVPRAKFAHRISWIADTTTDRDDASWLSSAAVVAVSALEETFA